MRSQDQPAAADEATADFFQPMQGAWTESDQERLAERLATDPEYAEAYHRVQRAWSALGDHADSPELLARRQEAIAYARMVSARRWKKMSRYGRRPWRAAAAVVASALTMAVLWQLSPYSYHPGIYSTDVGERRTVDLDDHSRVELDAGTAIQVRYSTDARVIRLKHGQAQFSVAKDFTRPFKVEVGDRTIVALGTVFTVDYTGQRLRVAMMEGRVAVVPHQAPSDSDEMQPSSSVNAKEVAKRVPDDAVSAAVSGNSVELSAGEELSISNGGRAKVTPNADLAAATAWREGKIVFQGVSLGEAVQRLNRYSRVQIDVADESLRAQLISGVFEAGDTRGFVRDIQRYLPVNADSSNSGKITLRMR